MPDIALSFRFVSPLPEHDAPFDLTRPHPPMASPPLALILLSLLALPALQCCGASSRELLAEDDLEQAYNSIYGTKQAANPRGSLVWRKMRWKLKGFTQEEIKDLLEALSHLEKELENNSSPQGESSVVGTSMSSGDDEEFIDDFGMSGMEIHQEEQHPADHLLQRYKADATISYILGGY